MDCGLLSWEISLSHRWLPIPRCFCAIWIPIEHCYMCFRFSLQWNCGLCSSGFCNSQISYEPYLSFILCYLALSTVSNFRIYWLDCVFGSLRTLFRLPNLYNVEQIGKRMISVEHISVWEEAFNAYLKYSRRIYYTDYLETKENCISVFDICCVTTFDRIRYIYHQYK